MLVLATLALLPAHARADNDDFADAVELIGSLPLSGAPVSNVKASAEPNEPDHVFESIATRSLWWKWTPAVETAVEASTSGSDFDTVMSVYQGASVDSLTKIVSNDDLDDFVLQSRVRFIAKAGVTYYIAVDGFTTPDTSASGMVHLSLLAFTSEPVNDHWKNATVLGGALPLTDATSSNVNATVEDGEPIHLSESNHAATVWWKWTASATMSVAFTSFDSGIDDSILAVYLGPASQAGADFSALTRVSNNDDNDAANGSTVAFKAFAGTTYYFAVGGVGNNEGALSVRLEAGPAPPVNDSFAAAITVLSGFSSGRNTGATTEAGEPNHLGSPPGSGPTSSAWWRYVPLGNSPVEVNTQNSLFDTVLAVYTGPSLDALTLVGRNDNAGGAQSRVRFDALAGQVYHIAVDGKNGSEGRVTLSIIEPGPSGPDNDDFVDAFNLGNSTAATATGNNIGAHSEEGEPALTASASAWWKWTAPATAKVEINTFDSDYDSTLGVYKGSDVDGLTLLAFNDNTGGPQSRVVFSAQVGQTYRIAVGGALGAEGNIALNLQVRGSYVVWLQAYPGLTGTDSDPGADPDGDGFINLQEMAFGLNPLVFSRPGGPDPNASHAPAYTIAANELRIEYEINPLYIGIAHNGGGPVTIDGRGGDSVLALNPTHPVFIGGNRYRVTVPVSSAVAKFLRVTITNPN